MAVPAALRAIDLADAQGCRLNRRGQPARSHAPAVPDKPATPRRARRLVALQYWLTGAETNGAKVSWQPALINTWRVHNRSLGAALPMTGAQVFTATIAGAVMRT